MPTATGQSLVRQLSDGSPDGTVLGQSSTDPIALFGGTPVAQPSGNAQAAVTRGLAAGVIATYHTATTPASAVTAQTSLEYVQTVQTGTGATMLIASGDLLFVNKPTSQAGLGVGNIRVSAGNTVGITYSNITSASITPTSAENYGVVALRGGSLNLTATLSPAAVAANSTVEQQFAVTGLPVGALVQVNKPTFQAGLDIGGCRVVSNNLLGITFVNPTSAAVTPTSAEVYRIVALPGLDAVNNDVFYGFNVGTVSATTVGNVLPVMSNTTITGLLTTDSITSITKPTQQATVSGGVVAGGIISAASALTISYLSVATWTPTSGEVYGIRTARLAPVAPLVLYTASIAPASVAALTTAEQTFTVSGLVAASPVWINKPTWTSGLAIMGVRVNAVSSIAITFANLTSAAIVPPTENYLIGNFQVPLPSAGNCVYQTVAPALSNTTNLSNALRTALGSSGLNAIAGA